MIHLLRIFVFFITGMIYSYATAQDRFSLSGHVADPEKNYLPGAAVQLLPVNKGTVTNDSGAFIFEGLTAGQYTLRVSYLGFREYSEIIILNKDQNRNIKLNMRLQTLQEVVVAENYSLRRNHEEVLHVDVVNDVYLKQNMQGSLMQSLERLPGISALEIGSGQSKPVIRGLAFNRVVVIENGLKHEGQQWGADHGLEIDQFAYNRIEIIKGPVALLYGSDAIGGVISLQQAGIPQKHTQGGSIDLIGKSNNHLAGASAYAYLRNENFFFNIRGTLLDYADYRVPADSIDIYSYKAAIHENRLRNTAGDEKNLHAIIGFQKNGTSAKLLISNVQSTQGFFANTHGLEPRRIDNAFHDKSSRDIQLPYQEVNHLKISGITSLHFTRFITQMELGYQNNNRKEWSQYTRHGYMPPTLPIHLDFPEELERQFDKSTWSGNVTVSSNLNNKTKVESGLSTDYQINNIDGRGFIIPEYEQLSAGFYLITKYKQTDRSLFQAGFRFDHGKLDIHPYHDWYPTPVESPAGTIDSMLQRSPSIARTFSNISWSAGYNYNGELFTFKINAGKGFRIPTAKELAANGVNYHRFSYEKGNTALSPEISFQLDAAIEFHNEKFALGATPFLNYFPNYIYLTPGYEHDRLYGNGNQIFNYIQSEVFRWGGELHAHYNFFKNLKTGAILNYIWSKQLSGDKKGFTLPFSPPTSALIHFKYESPNLNLLQNSYIGLDLNLIASQNKIVPPEVKTPGYSLINVSTGTDIKFAQHALTLNLQVQNLLNKAYFNHTSYYRLINVPGPSRNISLGLHYKF